ncbi:MAG TPA: HAMP domain-containing protein [Sphingobium sp.]|uniref:sensor histidine kinase n=1 Tax=unclassified Sphingobium TaxID=2611147 RepID=UPI0007F4D24C|nr:MULTISPECIES: ATP-binding protein [unclassified Sphingobium]OAN56413.1 PAS domain-containing sensor histidine kinase [Sphingobium sp. TCM1]WIW89714.1 ATP-binding protein [Sphingobium sp. V4]HAF40423.1 HAMP domain-containing protein [Sphingobium sp.]
MTGATTLRRRASAWRRHLPPFLRKGRLAPLVEGVTLALFLGMAGLTYHLLSGSRESYTLLTPPIVALLLVANLVPAIALLVLLGRRVAKRRAAQSAIGSDGQLHVRLVAIFSIVASVPMLLVVIFASLLFQYGVQFWFSDSARGMLQNASDLARGYYEQNLREVRDETLTMAGDLRDYLNQSEVSSPRFAEGYIYQVVTRKLNRSAIIEVGKDGIARTAATVDPENRPASEMLSPEAVKRLAAGEDIVVQARPNQVEAVTLLYPNSKIYLYATRNAGTSSFSNVTQAQKVLADYDIFSAQSRALQLRFNIALFVGSLLLVGIAVYIALAVADWMVRPVNELVTAARRITAGDLSARVTSPQSRDEIGTLAAAFNRMTQRLEAQTGALVAANSQLDERRAFIEAILSGVSAGVLSVDLQGVILLLNSSAAAILVEEGDDPVGRPLADVSPELAEFVESEEAAGIVQVRAHGDLRTLAVKLAQDASRHILTFDDITQQLSDQRRAAWSDVARRIAHEIKNPLTPIQLAAERLQRRYADEITSDKATFTRLTGTIVRQVGDLRRIVDEFSSFARMPKPVFRREAIGDIARHALFLHEVAHPDIRFEYSADAEEMDLVCDRRQLGQALTNIVKNAVEAIEPKTVPDEGGPRGHVRMRLMRDGDDLLISVRDDGIGLPPERERILEPYMTTRSKGTGLGLAIVKKIVEEHLGEIRFDDAEGGGACVTLRFAAGALEKLEEGQVITLPKGKVTANGA